jgi:hypothetical protein
MASATKSKSSTPSCLRSRQFAEMTAMFGASLALCISIFRSMARSPASSSAALMANSSSIRPLKQKAKSDINLTVAGTERHHDGRSRRRPGSGRGDARCHHVRLDAIKNSALSKKKSSKRLAKPNATSIFTPRIPRSKDIEGRIKRAFGQSHLDRR